MESKSKRFKPGDKVVLTGWGVGEDHWGGLAQLARVKSDSLSPLPEGVTLKRAMSIGTAGLTAMFCVMVSEEHGVRPDKGDVLVTGATGGVGCVAVMLLAGLGYRVVALTGKEHAHAFLSLSAPGKSSAAARSRGVATSRLNRDGGQVLSIRSVEKTLSAVLRQMNRDGCVTAVGLAGGAELRTTVYPFILRGVSLVGVSSGLHAGGAATRGLDAAGACQLLDGNARFDHANGHDWMTCPRSASRLSREKPAVALSSM